MIFLRTRIAFAVLSHAPVCVLGKAALLSLGAAGYSVWNGQISWPLFGAAVATGVLGLALQCFQIELALFLLAPSKAVATARRE